MARIAQQNQYYILTLFSLFLIQRGATSAARPVGRGSLRCYAGFDPSERSLVGEVGGRFLDSLHKSTNQYI
jgi:hypothetical protein